MAERKRPGAYLGAQYLGRISFSDVPPGGILVGIKAAGQGHPPEWMTDEEYSEVVALLGAQSEGTGA